MLLAINPHHPQPRLIAQVVSVLKAGGVIAYPTDTTYGIGCSIFSKKGLELIYQIKQRDRRKPFSFICADLSEVARFARLTNHAFKIMKRCLPGPYTFVLQASREVPDLLTTRQKTVGVRMPDHPICSALVRELGNPIVTTSANLSGEEPVGDPLEINRQFGSQLNLVIDGGLLTTDVSSVVSLVGDRIEILREGSGDLARILG
ncbi:L-threonylcarbamoyladenylate synthase [Trichlorobacter ammonificans]|uniref:Sua5/YciO/YrdC/YwlC family protein n=1 Tax=Trichlorobacter ammonificans TaxID=2916410 RepID=A0ABM9DAJ5_9BACT|nr:L-threonylcarbamoyladenylate synthase [Trichlorobacter ammonificans]CAH2031793.1 Sua5/YciO/YrdC/YwlC family protein [Trichlorobacter ammonificans]